MILLKLGRSVLSRPVSLNFLITFLGSIAPVFVLLMTVPIYISAIGVERYGVISMLWVFFGYVGLLDLGLSRATTYRLAQLGRDRNSEYFTSYWTSLALNAALGILLAGAFYVIASLGLSITNLSKASISSEISDALPGISILFPFVLLSNTFVGRLEAESRFRYLALANLIGSLLLQAAPILAVWALGVSIASATIGLVIARVIMTLALATPYILELRHARLGSVSRGEAAQLIKYGGWVSVSNIVSPILVSLDQFVIGYFVGARGVAHYSVAYSIVTKFWLLPSAVTRVLFPRLTAAGDEDRASMASLSLSITGWLLFPVVAVAVLALKPFLATWMGAEFATQAGPVAQILAVGVWINSIAHVPYSALHSRGLARLTAKFHLLELVPFVLILVVLVHFFGIQGAAFAWLLRCLIDCILLLNAASLVETSVKDSMLPAALLSAQLLLWLWWDPPLSLALIWAACACLLAAIRLISIASKIGSASETHGGKDDVGGTGAKPR